MPRPTLMKPYYEENGIKIYHGDCREVLSSLPKGSVDLVFTSPPYNMGKQSGDYANMRGGYLSHGDDLNDREYTAWQQSVLSACWNLLPSRGAIFYNHKPLIRNGAALLPTRLIPAEVIIRQIIIWHRRGGFNWNPRHFCGQHEWVMLLAKRDFTLISRSHSAVGDVWSIPIEQTDYSHPCPFPVELPTQAIAQTEAETILDPFMGSGTTGVACAIQGRKFVGVEIEERYCEVAVARIKRAQGVGVDIPRFNKRTAPAPLFDTA